MYTVLVFKAKQFKVNILDKTDDISLCCIPDVLSIHLQDLVIGEELLVGRSVCKSSWRTQNQKGTCGRLFNFYLFKRSSSITDVYKYMYFRAYTCLLSLQTFCTHKISKAMIFRIALQETEREVISWSSCTLCATNQIQ